MSERWRKVSTEQYEFTPFGEKDLKRTVQTPKGFHKFVSEFRQFMENLGGFDLSKEECGATILLPIKKGGEEKVVIRQVKFKRFSEDKE